MIAIETIENMTKDNLGLITVITGEDLGQYSQMKELFLKRIAFDKEDLAYSYFDISDNQFQQAEMDLQSLPFFADCKIVLFDQLLDITTQKKSYLNENDLKDLEAYLENPLETTRLVIFAPGKLDGKRRLVKLLKRDATLFEANPLKEHELNNYFQKYSHKLGLSFESGVFEKLLLKSSGDFSDMVKNLHFLKTYKNDGIISLDDIDEAIPKTLQDNIFDLSRYVLQKNIDASRQLVHDLRLSGEDDIKLIAVLLGQFRLYLQIAILSQDGKNEQQMVLALSDYLGRKINPYQVKYALRDSRTLSIPYLKSLVKILIKTDYQIKTGLYEKEYLFDLALLKMMTNTYL